MEIIEKIKQNNLIKNFTILLFGSGIGSLLGILNLGIILNTIGAEKNGMIIMIQTYVTLFSTIFSFKSFEAIIKYLSITIQNGDNEKSKQYIKFSYILDIVSMIVTVIFSYLFLDVAFRMLGFSEELKPYVQIYIISLLFNVTGTSVGIIRIYNEFDKSVKIGVLLMILKLMLYTFALINQYGFNYFLLIELLLSILNNISVTMLSLHILYKNKLIDFYKSRLKIDKEYLMFNIYSSIYTTIDIPVSQLTTILINKYLGFTEVSVYNVFIRISSIILKIQSPLSQIIYPEMNIRIAKGDTKSSVNLYKKLFKWIMSIGIIVVIMMSITYKYWMVIFIKNYEIYLVPLMIYMMYVVYTSASKSIHDLFVALGYIKYNIKILLPVNIIYLILLYNLIKLLGLQGVIISLFLQSILVIQCKKVILRKGMYL